MEYRCGYVGIIGKPNAGKSTLLNRLLGQKISITSRRPQTTRHRIAGIYSTDNAQAIYLDTPGLHQSRGKAMNRYLNKSAKTAIHDVDVLILVVVAGSWSHEDDYVADALQHAKAPLLVVVNKIDQLKDKSKLLPYLAKLGKHFPGAEIIPASARTGDNVDNIQQMVLDRLPENPPVYDPEQITDRSERFIAAEFIREKLTRRLTSELPYALTVEIADFKTEGNLRKISAIIWVEREGQKAIVIGEKGSVLKLVGKGARLDLEALLGSKVHLDLWVKVRKGWSDDEQSMARLGYSE